MAGFIPDANLPREVAKWRDWVQRWRKDQDKLNDEFRRFMARFGKEVSAGARQTAVINNRTTNLASTVSNLSGVPEGGFRGSVLVRDEGGGLSWSTPIGSVVPRYWIYLSAAGSSYEVATFGSVTTQVEAKKLLPAPLFEYGAATTMDWPISWGDEWNSFSNPLRSSALPIELEVYVYPEFDGESFEICLPDSFVSGAPWFTVTIVNDGDFIADVRISSDDALFYDGGLYLQPQWDMVAGEYVAWRVDNVFHDGVGLVHPFWRTGLALVPYPTDGHYWKNVRALEQQESITALGNVTTATGLLGMTNARNTHVRIGKVTARVGTAPTGSGVQIQFYKNGTDAILTTPLEIAAGDLYAEAIPDDATTAITAAPLPGDPIVVLAPGEFLTASILAVGSTTPGANLTVQVYFG